MKKEKDYTLSIDVHVTKEDSPTSKRWYSIKIYGHPIQETLGCFDIDLSNMRDEQALKVGKKCLEAIWELVDKRDGDYWEA
jgi:hypothetical protein